MGIRFQCPNGHKINVKAFLAGKRARCPDCGAKVVVPFESQATPTLSAMPATAPVASEAAASAAAPNGAGGAQAAKRTATAPVAAATGSTVAIATAAPVSAHAPRTAISPTFNANLAAAAAVVSAPLAPLAPAMPTAVAIDPISEAPQAVWYVRPRSGGQFGPAPGDIFRQWIAQRRVTADSLVWRDGWADWRPAGEVLPQLAARTPPAFAAAPSMAMPATAASPAPDAPATRYIRSRRSKSSTIVAIGVLGVVALALVGVLIFILTRQP